MKIVTIEGTEHEVPDKANYVAMDKDGGWWWYERKPWRQTNTSKWHFNGDFGPIAISANFWESTLRKI